LDQLREHQEILEPELSLHRSAKQFADLRIGERPKDFLGNGGGKDQLECPLTQEPLHDLTGRTLGLKEGCRRSSRGMRAALDRRSDVAGFGRASEPTPAPREPTP